MIKIIIIYTVFTLYKLLLSPTINATKFSLETRFILPDCSLLIDEGRKLVKQFYTNSHSPFRKWKRSDHVIFNKGDNDEEEQEDQEEEDNEDDDGIIDGARSSGFLLYGRSLAISD